MYTTFPICFFILSDQYQAIQMDDSCLLFCYETNDPFYFIIFYVCTLKSNWLFVLTIQEKHITSTRQLLSSFAIVVGTGAWV